jgi:2-polyprenyl-6-hydroxyphenyl methylase / 3-demethylubiquinone-9 3-methyltransferase
VVGAEYVLGLLPKGTHDYRKFIKPHELAEAVRRAGLLVRDVVGMRYNPFTRNCSLSSDVDVNYLLHASKALTIPNSPKPARSGATGPPPTAWPIG